MHRYLHIIWYIFVTAAVCAVTGCSGADSPSNLEPVITVMEATDITRNEATISARIEKHGTVDLSYIHFVYGVEDGEEIKSADLTPVDGGISLNLTGLFARYYIFLLCRGGNIHRCYPF